MYHPSASQRFVPIRAALDVWAREADGFRGMLLATRAGERPTSRVLDAVEEAHDGLIAALEEIDRLLGGLPAGDADFPHLLLAQTMALGLLDSVGKSLDRLTRFAIEPATAPSRIRHPLVERFRPSVRVEA